MDNRARALLSMIEDNEGNYARFNERLNYEFLRSRLLLRASHARAPRPLGTGRQGQVPRTVRVALVVLRRRTIWD